MKASSYLIKLDYSVIAGSCNKRNKMEFHINTLLVKQAYDTGNKYRILLVQPEKKNISSLKKLMSESF